MDFPRQPQTGGLSRRGSALLLTAAVAVFTMVVAAPASATSYGASAWGKNLFGQLGDGTSLGDGTMGCCVYNRYEPVAVSGLSGVTAVSAGVEFSLALSNGTVMAWGENHEGQLGDGLSDIYSPKLKEIPQGPELCNQETTSCSRIPRAVPGLSEVTAISAGQGFSLALMKDHTVTAWGYPMYGDLGNGNDGKERPEQQPERGLVTGLQKVTAISAGMHYSLALLEDGTVMAWGYNGQGQLGNPIGPSTCGENLVAPCSATPVAVKGLKDVIAISAGTEQSLALLKSGTVMAWGGNGVGLLGNGETGEPVTVPVAVCAVGATTTPCSAENENVLTGVTAIAAGDQFSMALLADHTVTAWGDNGNKELGAWPAGGSNVPVVVNGLSEVTAISAAEKGGFALLSNGEARAWGFGFLGNGDETQEAKEVPVAVCAPSTGGPWVGPCPTGPLHGVAGIASRYEDNISFGAPIPSVTSVSPSSGPGYGATPVTITGAGLSEATDVKFGATSAKFTVTSPTSITAESPGGTGTVDVTVATALYVSATSKADQFTYIGAPPEYGDCVKVQAEKEKGKTVYHGGYTANSCLVISGTKTGKYEWAPGAPPKAKFMTKLKEKAVVTFETVTKAKVVCKGETGTGEYTGPKTVGNVVDTFTGCESQKFKEVQKNKCNTAGHAEGELVTSTLEGILGWDNKPAKIVANDLFPVGHFGPLLEFSCAGVPVQVRGSVIVKVASGKMLPLAKTETVTFAASGAKQTPEKFEGGVKDVLEFSFGVGAFEQTGLKMTTIQTSEEQLEINWSV